MDGNQRIHCACRIISPVILLPLITSIVHRLKSAQYPAAMVLIPLIGIPWYLVIVVLGILFAFPAGLIQVNPQSYTDAVMNFSMLGFYWVPILLLGLLLGRSKTKLVINIRPCDVG